MIKRCSALFILVIAGVTARADEPPHFGRDILPILSENCFQCHGPDEQSRKGKLRLDTREGATATRGYSTAIVPGDPRKSELLQRLTTTEETEVMPPPRTGKKLTAQQIAILRRWIESGAPWGKHWAYEKPERPTPPSQGGEKPTTPPLTKGG